MSEKNFEDLVAQYEQIREHLKTISDPEKRHNFVIDEIEKFSFEELRMLMYHIANKNKEE